MGTCCARLARICYKLRAWCGHIACELRAEWCKLERATCLAPHASRDACQRLHLRANDYTTTHAHTHTHTMTHLNHTFLKDLWSSWLGRRPPDPKIAGSIPGECTVNGSNGLTWRQSDSECTCAYLSESGKCHCNSPQPPLNAAFHPNIWCSGYHVGPRRQNNAGSTPTADICRGSQCTLCIML